MSTLKEQKSLNRIAVPRYQDGYKVNFFAPNTMILMSSNSLLFIQQFKFMDTQWSSTQWQLRNFLFNKLNQESLTTSQLTTAGTVWYGSIIIISFRYITQCPSQSIENLQMITTRWVSLNLLLKQCVTIYITLRVQT